MKESEVIIPIPLDKVHVSKLNTRQPKRSDPDVKELAESLQANGQTTPAIVRPFTGKKGHYEIAAGARRKVSCSVIKLETLDCIIRDLPDKEFEELILIENLQRKNPDAKAEARNLARLVEKEGKTPDIGGLASRLGKSPSWVARRLKLLKVLPPLRKQWEEGSLDHFNVEMMELIGSLDQSLQEEIAKKLANGHCWIFQDCTSRSDLENIIKENYSCRLDEAPFPLDDPEFQGACGEGGCSSNSEASPLLFDFQNDEEKGCARCLNSSCFLGRLEKWQTHQLIQVERGEKDLIYFSRGQCHEVKREDGTIVKPLQSWELHSNYKLEVGKKKDKGSRRAIDLTNPNQPKSVYLVPTPQRNSPSTAGTDQIPQDSEELKRNLWQARRWVSVHEKLCEAIKDSECKQLTEDPFEVAAMFGLSYSCRDGDPKDWEAFDNRHNPQPYRGLARFSKESFTMEQHVWEGLKGVFTSRLQFNRVIDCLAVVPEMESVAKLIGFDLEKAKLEADGKIPPPKSWGKVDPHTLLAA